MAEDRDNPGIKIPYLRIDKPLVEGTRCVEIRIPDHDDYMPVLSGLVAIATRWFNYERDDTHKGTQLAALWRQAYLETDWNQCMNCEELTACIQPLLDAQRTQILNDIRYGNDSGVPPGTRPPDSQNTANQAEGTNPECDKDILWAQCTQMVEWITGRASDALQIAETATNDIELIGALMGLPIVQEAGIAAVADYINLMLEGFAENFEAQVTEEYKSEYACLFMQECCTDCVVTIDRLYTAAEKRLRTHFADLPTTFATVFDLWSYLSDQDIDGTIVADAIIFMGIGGGALANAFFADVGDRPLQTVLLLAVNDANDDWLLLCPDCPEVCTEPSFRIVNPLGFSGGSVIVTDNMDGTWTAVGTAAFDTDSYRLAFVEENTSCCWNTLAASYSSTPENLNAQYNCGANPDDTDYGNGIGTGPLTVGLCASGAIASDTDTPFTITWTFEAC